MEKKCSDMWQWSTATGTSLYVIDQVLSYLGPVKQYTIKTVPLVRVQRVILGHVHWELWSPSEQWTLGRKKIKYIWKTTILK